MDQKTKKHLEIGCLTVTGIFILLFFAALFFAPTHRVKKAHEEGGEQAGQRLRKKSETTWEDRIPSRHSMSVKEEKPIEKPAQKPQNFNWRYKEEDKMEGVTVYFAQTTARGLLHFDFPYNGGSKSTLTIRKDKKQVFTIRYPKVK